jgi:hypothetical protein
MLQRAVGVDLVHSADELVAATVQCPNQARANTGIAECPSQLPDESHE